jgi:hypothetical protein
VETALALATRAAADDAAIFPLTDLLVALCKRTGGCDRAEVRERERERDPTTLLTLPAHDLLVFTCTLLPSHPH